MTEAEHGPDDGFGIDHLPIAIHCPRCGNAMVHDPDSLPRAESPRGAMFECGSRGEITQWRFTLDPFVLEQVAPTTWGGTV